MAVSLDGVSSRKIIDLLSSLLVKSRVGSFARLTDVLKRMAITAINFKIDFITLVLGLMNKFDYKTRHETSPQLPPVCPIYVLF
jgi:hypothetical protein